MDVLTCSVALDFCNKLKIQCELSTHARRVFDLQRAAQYHFVIINRVAVKSAEVRLYVHLKQGGCFICEGLAKNWWVVVGIFVELSDEGVEVEGFFVNGACRWTGCVFFEHEEHGNV